MLKVKFPVIVEAEDFEGQGCDILGSELIRVGATVERGWNPDWKYHFYYGDECEVIKDDC